MGKKQKPTLQYYKNLKYNGDFDCYETKKTAYESEFVDEFTNLLINAIKIKGLPYTRQAFIKKTFIERGFIGYDKLVDLWAYITPSGQNEENFPVSAQFSTANGNTIYNRDLSYDDNENGAFIIYALPNKNSFMSMIDNVAEILAQLSVGIRQNIIAKQAPDVSIVDDPELLLSIKSAIEQRTDGKPVIAVTSKIANAFKGIKNETEFIADKLLLLRTEIKNEFLTKIGILTANTNKRERVQSAEISAGVGECVDSIYLMIDTFNGQCEQYGLPFKMELNEVIEDFYTPTETTETAETNQNKIKEINKNEY